MKIIFTCHDVSMNAAIREIRLAFGVGDTAKRIGPDTAIVGLPGDFSDISRIFREKPLLFTRHIFPVTFALPPESDPAQAARDIANMLDIEQSFSVQARAHDGNAPTRELSAALREMGYSLDIKNPQQVVSVYRARDALYVGVSDVTDNLSGWNGGMMHFRLDGAVSRAEFKLLEALRTFFPDIAEASDALDLGAAPGGWCRVLAGQYNMRVAAVDPAPLDPCVYALENVTHFKQTAMEFMREQPDMTFDLIVNDMKMDARLSLDTMLLFSDKLRPEGMFLATLKLPRIRFDDAAQAALARLRAQTNLFFARQLFHNRSEITVGFSPLTKE